MTLSVVWLAQSLILGSMSTAQRREVLSPFFSPRPGQILELPRKALADPKKDPLLLTGTLAITPPKGQCLRVRRDIDRPDQKICRTESLSWSLHEIDPAGRIHRLVIAGNPDAGTLLTWQTPYRMANFVELGEKASGQDHDLPIISCTARQQEDIIGGRKILERYIVLNLANGRRWRIDFPAFDTALAATLLEEEAKRKEKSRLSQLLAGEKIEEQKVAYYFRVTGKDTFEMSSSFFREGDSPGGLKGKCRYKFKGAPDDPSSGVIECYDTHSLDAVYAPLTCMQQLAVIPRPEANPEQGGKP